MSEQTPATGTPETPETTPAAPETGQAPDPAAEPATGEEKDWKAEFEKLQQHARKWEDRAKANTAAAKELERVRRESMSETERAVAEAAEKTRAELRIEFGGRLVDAEVRAATAGRPVDAEALLEGLDRSRFLTDDGEPDADAIAKWVDRIAPAPASEEPPAGFPDLGQGVRPQSQGQGMALNGDPLMRDLKSKLGIR